VTGCRLTTRGFLAIWSQVLRFVTRSALDSERRVGTADHVGAPSRDCGRFRSELLCGSGRAATADRTWSALSVTASAATSSYGMNAWSMPDSSGATTARGHAGSRRQS
jgi:hypothetical protein